MGEPQQHKRRRKRDDTDDVRSFGEKTGMREGERRRQNGASGYPHYFRGNNDGNSTPPLLDGQTEYIATHVVVSGSAPWSQRQTILRYPHVRFVTREAEIICPY